MKKHKQQPQPALLPGMPRPAFGGVQLTPIDLGKPYTGHWFGTTAPDGQQASLWDMVDQSYHLSEYGDTDATD